MHLPPHPFWFWLILGVPFFFLLALWVAANTLQKSLKPLTPWLWGGYGVFLVPYLLFDLEMPGHHRALRMVSWMVVWSCYNAVFWIKRHYMFETCGAQAKSGIGLGAVWDFPFPRIR